MSGLLAVLFLLWIWLVRWLLNVFDPPAMSYEEWERKTKGGGGHG